MPILYKFVIKNNSFFANTNSTKQKVKDGVRKGLYLGADELRDYIKNDLLSGRLVNKRTGQLRNSLYVRRMGDRISIFYRGIHRRENSSDEFEIPNSVLANILETGLNKSWYQPKRNQWHRGIKPHYFMREGIARKKDRIISLIKSNVYNALRNR